MPFNLKSFAQRPRVTDGVYGTELQKSGLIAGDCPEILNIENPEAVEAVTRSYVEAGSDVVMTNSLGANRFILDRYGAAERALELARTAASISRRAVQGTETKVFGSFGPTGKMVMTGQTAREDIFNAFVETTEGLASGGVDAIVLETFNELAEAEIALRAVKKVCDLPVVVSMAFAFGPDKSCTMMGENPADLAAMASENGADAIGANCGLGPDGYICVAEMLRTAWELPIWVKPNAGLPVVTNGTTSFPMGAEEFGGFVPKLIKAGAGFIGGCCGTTPEHIRIIRRLVDENWSKL